jgi:hypothetical protein
MYPERYSVSNGSWDTRDLAYFNGAGNRRVLRLLPEPAAVNSAEAEQARPEDGQGRWLRHGGLGNRLGYLR